MCIKNVFYSLVICLGLVIPAHAADIKVETRNNVHFLSITGPIQEGDHNKIRDLDVKYDFKVVFINSAGGNITEGMLIADQILKMNIDAVIPQDGECLMPCGVVFLMAKDRFVMDNAKLSIVYINKLDNPEFNMVLNSMMSYLMGKRGVPPEIVYNSIMTKGPYYITETINHDLDIGLRYVDRQPMN